jgi:hypothetical protein
VGCVTPVDECSWSARAAEPDHQRGDTDASVPDVAMTEPIHAELARRRVLPAEHNADSGYPSMDLLVSSLAMQVASGTVSSMWIAPLVDAPGSR